jgi:hypothetical protein
LTSERDLEPWTSSVRMTPRGLVDDEELEQDRVRVEAELKRRAERRAREEAARREQVAAAERYERAGDEAFRRELPEGLR